MVGRTRHLHRFVETDHGCGTRSMCGAQRRPRSPPDTDGADKSNDEVRPHSVGVVSAV